MKLYIFKMVIWLIPFLLIAQNKISDPVYLLFDLKSDEKCQISVEGEGLLNLNKYRVEYAGKHIDFNICNEKFRYDKKSNIDTCYIISLKDLKIKDLEYLNKKKAETLLRSNPFEKIFLIDIISPNTIVKYPVKWIDSWIIGQD